MTDGLLLFVRVLLLGLALGSAVPAIAEDPTQQAIDQWLAADDAAAFPALSALAEAGDERAMLFLGAIERRSLGNPYLTRLDRETRNRMLRAPGGLSGRSWLTRVTSEKALADALIAAREGDPVPLLVHDQPHAASEAILVSFNAAPWSLVAINRATPVPDELRHLVWVGADMGLSPEIVGATLSDDEREDLRAALAEAADPAWQDSLQLAMFQSMQLPQSSLPAPPLVAALTGQILRRGEFEARTLGVYSDATVEERQVAIAQARAILETAAEAAPIRRLCAEACPANPDECTATAWSIIGGGMTLGAFHTPLDSLVDQATYLSSSRYLADLRRAARSGHPDADACGSRLLESR
jgi:hypothetical protein